MMFSIIMATYNRAYIITRAIESVLRQTIPEWELIIIDDGSTDNTCEVIKKFKSDSKIKYVRLPQNQGVNHARNIGIEQANGDYIIFLDSDNLLFPNALEVFSALLERTHLPIVWTSVLTVDGKKLSHIPKYNKVFYSFEDFFCEKLRGEFHCAARRTLLLKHPFEEDVVGGEHITWKKIVKEVGIVFVSTQKTLLYDNTLSDRLSIKKKNYKRLAKIFRKDLEVFGKDYLKFCPFKFAEKLLKFSVYKTLSLMKG